MMHLLATFAAFSLSGTVILALLPEGGVKRTAGMAVGILTLSCWVEGVAALFDYTFPSAETVSPLIPTSITVEGAVQDASASLSAQWEALP